jgi:hypothetical protein
MAEDHTFTVAVKTWNFTSVTKFTHSDRLKNGLSNRQIL